MNDWQSDLILLLQMYLYGLCLFVNFQIGISPRQCFQQTDRGMVLSVMLIHLYSFTLLFFSLFDAHFVMFALSQGLQNLPVYIGCPPGNRLVFDANTTLLEAVQLNRRNFSCMNPDPVTPCFYYKNCKNLLPVTLSLHVDFSVSTVSLSLLLQTLVSFSCALAPHLFVYLSSTVSILVCQVSCPLCVVVLTTLLDLLSLIY